MRLLKISVDKKILPGCSLDDLLWSWMVKIQRLLAFGLYLHLNHHQKLHFTTYTCWLFRHLKMRIGSLQMKKCFHWVLCQVFGIIVSHIATSMGNSCASNTAIALLLNINFSLSVAPVIYLIYLWKIGFQSNMVAISHEVCSLMINFNHPVQRARLRVHINLSPVVRNMTWWSSVLSCSFGIWRYVNIFLLENCRRWTNNAFQATTMAKWKRFVNKLKSLTVWKKAWKLNPQHILKQELYSILL